MMAFYNEAADRCLIIVISKIIVHSIWKALKEIVVALKTNALLMVNID